MPPTTSLKPSSSKPASNPKKISATNHMGGHLYPKPHQGTISQMNELSREYDFTNHMVASILDVTTKTLSRYQENSRPLSEQQKDRIRVVESILDLGKQVLGSEAEVKHWLHEPVLSLENRKPIDLILTESGRRRVENVLLQIEGGVY